MEKYIVRLFTAQQENYGLLTDDKPKLSRRRKVTVPTEEKRRAPESERRCRNVSMRNKLTDASKTWMMDDDMDKKKSDVV